MGSFGNDGVRVSHSRKGLSFVEFVGCLCALGGGVALGSFYLGVDMKTMCTTVLEQAEIVDPGYFSDKDSVASETETTVEQSAEESPVSLESVGTSEIGITTPIAESSDSPSASNESDPIESVPSTEADEASDEQLIEDTADHPELTEEEKFVATKKYWLALVTCINDEVKARTTTPGNHDSWQLFDYLSHRAEGHETAVEEIDSLDELGVDSKLLLHAKQVRTWHHAGAKLYRRAVNLLTDSHNDQLTGPFAQSWQSAATQHRMEEKLVRDKHESMSSYLQHTYKDVGSVNPAH